MQRIVFIRKALNYFNLETELDDFDIIHENISKDIVFKGTNLWILIFAIIIASIGLNMNSTAVIIGAMLISPLMGPINGMGYSIATYNFPLFRRSLKNFAFAVVASLVASTTYFALSPISTAQSELLARTSPTIYDVLIALFGGLAGIVAISSKHKGNVIPGVAIATALMPPLCTAGFGLATGNFYYFIGAIYLFTINTVFIALSSVFISQILKFPIRTISLDSQRTKVNRWISLVTILILIPSIYFGYVLVQKEKFLANATNYVRNISIVEGNYLLKNEIDPKSKKIILVYGGANMNNDQKEKIKEKAKDFSIDNAKIIFQQGLSFDLINNKNSEVETLKAEMNRLNTLLKLNENRVDSISQSKLLGKQIYYEIKNLYPQIISCSYASTLLFNDTLVNSNQMEIVAFNTKGNINSIDKKKIGQWLQARLKTEKIKVYFENQ
ncbi:MAG: DUF389 domain-containing protein [Bacteroidetes bacterium]|nr:DUF389 domain-containing protein [Bacteroidota bacterium]HET6244481.1 DUF389 domain-containing protein [Bacteroidia bacterium]